MENSEIILTKPEKLAKIIYEAIIRYTKAQNALNRGRCRDLSLDFLCNPSGNDTKKIDQLGNKNDIK